jgi:hemerythrin-like metal-binding protein/PAS domain S-box-containing protein
VDAIDIFPWNDHFSTGLDEIDLQHKRLIELLNRLASQVANGAQASVLDGIFDELAEYAVYHFDTEEAIWHTYLAGEPDEIAHRAVHHRFRQDVGQLKSALRNQTEHEVAEKALHFLAHWLASHILEADRGLACIVRALQRGLPRQEAHRQARNEMGGATRTLIDLILSIYASLSTNTLRLMRELPEHRQAAAELEAARITLGRERIQLRTLINTLPDLVWLKDPDGVYLSCNKRAEQLYGITEAQAIGHTDRDFVSPELAEIFRAHDLAAIQNKGPMVNQEEVTFADGHRELLETTKTPMFDEDGQLIGVLGIGHDISHLKRTERELQKQLEFSRALNRIADILVTQQDSEQILEGSARVIGETLDADRALIYDISFSTGQATVLCEWLNPDCPIRPARNNYPLTAFPQSLDELWRTRRGLVSHTGSMHPLLQAEGSGEVLHNRLMVRSLLWHPFSFREDGFYLLVINQLQQQREWSDQDKAFLEDISHGASVALEKVRLLRQRDQAEADLRIAAKAFEAQEGIVITDAEERIIRVNSAYTRITGYSQDDVVGRRPSIVSSG